MDVPPQDVGTKDDIAPVLADGHVEEQVTPVDFALTHVGRDTVAVMGLHCEEKDVHE